MQAPVLSAPQAKPVTFITRWWRRWTAREPAPDPIAALERSDMPDATRADRAVVQLQTQPGRWPDETDLLSRRFGAMTFERSVTPHASRHDALRSEPDHEIAMRRRRWRAF